MNNHKPFTILVSRYMVFFYHYMVVLPSDKGFLFIHNTPFNGVQFDNDLKNRNIVAQIDLSDSLTEKEKSEILQRANLATYHNFKYDLFTFNCEHFINWLLTGKIIESQQIAAFVSVLSKIKIP